MTPLEELQAAYKRLSELRSSTASAPWREGYADPGEGLFDLDDSHGSTVAEVFRGTDIELIVTLHRTIDAQLSILDNAMLNEGAVGRLRPENADTKVSIGLLLARAINGEAS